MGEQEEIYRSERAVPRGILVVEDEVSVARALQMILQEEGYAVDLAMTGQSAMDQLDLKKFDLLVADLRLPDVDGMEIIKRVRGSDESTAVIVITGFPSVVSAVDAMKLGVFDYLSKPFTDSEFKAVVVSALKERVENLAEKSCLDEAGPQENTLIRRREVIKVLGEVARKRDSLPYLIEEETDVLNDHRLSPKPKSTVVSRNRDLRFVSTRLERPQNNSSARRQDPRGSEEGHWVNSWWGRLRAAITLSNL